MSLKAVSRGSGGSSGVESLNSLTGALDLTSTGGSIIITPLGTNINLEALGTVTTTGSPASGNLTKFSGANSITNGDLSGDLSTSGTLATTLATVNSNVGTFGSASKTVTTTVNAKGLTTAISQQDILIAESQVTNLVSDLAGKQPTGNYITALTGDGTASGPGSAAFTLATVNSNIGSFTNASVTVNAKGLVTAASNGTAPVTSVSGTANRITSTGGTTPVIDIAATYVGQNSITTLGTIGTGVWQGTKVGLPYGGTNADLSATGGTSQVLRQSTVGGAVTVSQLNYSDLAGSAPVTSVSNSDGTLTISPTTGAVVGSLNLGHANTWTALQTFQAATSGKAIVAKAAATTPGNIQEWQDSSANIEVSIGALGSAVFNEQGNDADFRIEGGTQANLFFVDASTDRIGIGTNAPTARVRVVGDQPTAVSSGSGTTADPGFQVLAGTGGNTSSSSVVTGGNGGSIALNTGDGGKTTSASIVTARGGAGGAFALTGGVGGAADLGGSVNNNAGAGAAVSITAGGGGAASGATSGTNTGGTGGDVTISAGAGGLSSNGATNNSGSAGDVTVQGGTAAAGAGSGGGSVTIKASAGTSTGTGGIGGILSLTGGSAGGDDTVNRSGGSVTVTSGSSKGSTAGGTINISSGTGGAGTGSAGAAGGTILITSGTGGAGSATGGNGGSLSLKGGTGGVSTTGGNGGSVTVQGGTAAAAVASSGGSVSIIGANGTSTSTGGTGGVLALTAGDAGGDNTVNRAGGSITANGGDSKGSNTGGVITLTSGRGGPGTGTAGVSGGTLTIVAGPGGVGSATGGNGGNVSIRGGLGGNSASQGSGGSILLQTAATTVIVTRVTVDNNGQALFEPGTTGTIGIVVQAQASHSANLQEWQNSSSAVLASISPAGKLFANQTPIILSTTTGINGKTIANTALYTVPTGKSAIVTGYTVRCSAASAITVGASAGIGNIAGTSNISASQTMTALTTTTDDFYWAVIGASKVTAAAGVIYFNLGTAATGTTQTLVVDLIGYIV